MRRALLADPEAAVELRALIDELAPPVPGQRIGVVNNSFTGSSRNGTVIQAGNIENFKNPYGGQG